MTRMPGSTDSSRHPTRRTRFRIVGAALVLFACATALQAEPPIWVIEDEDSTLYLFGTVHLLDPEIEWLTPRVEQALGEASEVWFEIPMPATMEEVQAQQAPMLLRRAFSPGQPLSSLLTEDEQAQLRRALARTPDAAQLGMVLEQMKPWFATLTLGTAPLMAAGYEAGAGADLVLAGIAHARGVTVRGFETAEQQVDFLSAGTDEEQLTALRDFLSTSDEEFDHALALGDAAFRAWMEGETAPLEAMIAAWREGVGVMGATLSYDEMLANRNEDWAGQIEHMLAGAGVVFIAVGAGHLVGPDSVQARLAVRGISVQRH
jgi:uncharacterized protein